MLLCDKIASGTGLFIGESSNGRTTDSGSVYLGSNPGSPASEFDQHPCGGGQLIEV